jgi:hypothetical protein
MKLNQMTSATAAALLVMSAGAAAATTYTGPTYPAPGGTTFTPGAGSTITGGKTNTYSGFDLSQTNDLYFTFEADEGIDSTTGLHLDLSASNLAGGVAVYDGVNTGFNVRFTATFTNTSNVALALTQSNLANGGGFSSSGLGGGLSGSNTAALLVNGDFKVTEAFTLNGVASSGEFNSWEQSNHFAGNSLISNVNGGFYYSDNPVGGGAPEPAGWALMIIGFGGIGASLRRRRSVAAA